MKTSQVSSALKVTILSASTKNYCKDVHIRWVNLLPDFYIIVCAKFRCYPLVSTVLHIILMIHCYATIKRLCLRINIQRLSTVRHTKSMLMIHMYGPAIIFHATKTLVPIAGQTLLNIPQTAYINTIYVKIYVANNAFTLSSPKHYT